MMSDLCKKCADCDETIVFGCDVYRDDKDLLCVAC